MIKKSELVSLDYQDVVLTPKQSRVNSRSDVNLNINGKGHHPVFCSPMKNIATPELIIKLGYLGGVGILHRFFDNEMDRYNAIEQIAEHRIPWGIAIGINDWENELKFVDFAYGLGAKYICIDSANGHNRRVIDATNKLAARRFMDDLDFDIIVGNVVTYEGALELAKACANHIRVGIGNGGLCATSNVTAVGMPSLTAIQDCSRVKEYFPVNIVADGGIKSSGEAMKAFAFNADSVMIGSMFGRAIEAKNNGMIYGMSSTTLQVMMNKQTKSNEGIVQHIPLNEIRPLEEIYNEFLYGVRSGLSYLNIDDINDIHKHTIEYVEVGRGTLKQL